MLKVINTRILLSGITLLAAAVLIIGATSAFFSDTENSQNNVLAAGAIDLKIDNTSYYNHASSSATTWQLKDLTSTELFFNFLDIKPGDEGEDTISIHVDDNNAWACMDMTLTKDDDVDCTEPESSEDPNCNIPNPEPNVDLFDGELGSLLNFIFWTDDGDNVFETDEPIIASGAAESVLNSSIVLADSVENNVGGAPGDPLFGTETYYIGKAWCFGTLTQNPLPQGAGNPIINTGVLCDGSGLNSASQTDSVMADLSFSAVQHRNNPSFTCDGTTPSITPSVSPSPTPTPTVAACKQADVMLVLDRSGSINPTELGQLKTAANAFVTSLGLTPLGIHAGQSSFATLGTLDQILTDNPASLTTSINALVSSGFTNLKSGIDLAAGELSGGNDRADITSPDKMIVITDGNPNRPFPSDTADDVAAASATAFKGAGGEVFVVGVGGDINTAYLQGIATDLGHYYSTADYSGLQTALAILDLCQ